MNNYTVLLVTMELNIGGVETHIVELAKELAKEGLRVFVASNGGVYVKELAAAGVEHIWAPLHNKRPDNVLKSYRILKRAITEHKVDVVHAHARIPGFICGRLHKKMRFPFVTTAHWVFRTSHGLKYITDWGQKTLAVSEDIKQYLIDNYQLLPQNISLTINGIDTDKFSPDIDTEDVRREFDLSGTKNRIVYCSRMDADRSAAAFMLLEAALELDEAIENLEIVIVGGGNTYDKLLAEADAVNQKAGRRLVICTGARTDVNKFVALGTVFVGVSRAALEAMAAQKPVVVAGNEGYIGLFGPDKLNVGIATNFCCRGCEKTSKELLLSDLKEVFAMTEQQRASLGAFSRKTVEEHYSVKTMAGQNLRMYESVLKGGK